MRELEHEFGDSLTVVGVHSAKFPAEKETDNLRQAVLRNGLEHPVVNDGEHAVWGDYAVRAWPTLMFLDPHGGVIGKHEGEFDLDPMRAVLREAVDSFEADGWLVRGPHVFTPDPAPDTGALRYPGKVLADEASNRLFIADSGHHQIVVTGLDGLVQRRVGSGRPGFADGPAETAAFNEPQGMALAPDGERLLVADRGSHAVRAIDLATGAVTTVAGTGERTYDRLGGPARQTPLASPYDLVYEGEDLWIAMAGTHQLWVYSEKADWVEPRAGTGAESIHDGPLAEATFAQPSGVTLLDGVFYVADSESSAVRRVDPAADRVRRLVGRGLFEFGDVDARGDSVRLQHPLGICAVEEDGRTVVYLADSYNDKVKRLDPATREVETVLGGSGHDLVDGDFEEAELWEPGGLSIAGRTLYIADTNHHAVRAADLDTRTLRTLAIRELGAKCRQRASPVAQSDLM